MRRISECLFAWLLMQQGIAWAQIDVAQRTSIEKGLTWLAKSQQRNGGWADGDVKSTSTAGLAFLMEGSTSTKGKFKENVEKALEWVWGNCGQGKLDGLIGVVTDQNRMHMTGQADAILFVASELSREQDPSAKGLEARLAKIRRKEREDLLARMVQYLLRAKPEAGGCDSFSGEEPISVWVSARQIQALRAAKMAGVDVPKEVFTNAYAFLEKITGESGGLPQFHPGKQKRSDQACVEATLGAYAATLGAEELKPELASRWLNASLKGYHNHTLRMEPPNRDVVLAVVAGRSRGADPHWESNAYRGCWGRKKRTGDFESLGPIRRRSPPGSAL